MLAKRQHARWPQPRTAHEEQTPRSGVRAIGGLEKVLVISDLDEHQEELALLLLEGGFDPVTLASAIGATQAILRNSIQVIVADVSFPGASADILVRALRNNPRLPPLRIITISDSLDAVVSAPSESKADAHIARQRSAEELAPLVGRFVQQLRRRHEASRALGA